MESLSSRKGPTSSFARDATAASAASVYITLQSTWTNETFSNALCSAIASDTTRVSISFYSSGVRFLLPDCFYLKSGSLNDISFSSIIIQGNSTQPDPFKRLAAVISSRPTSFELVDCCTIRDTGETAVIDWNSLTFITSSVSKLVLQRTNLGIGSTIPTFPKFIPALTLESCGLTGTLPAQLYQSLPDAPVTTYLVSFLSNNLTGSIPSTLLTGLDISTLVRLTVDLSRNQLNGTFPSSLFAGHFAAVEQVSVTLAYNAFSGPVNNIFASSTFNPTSLRQFSAVCRTNNFVGVVPSWISMMPILTDYTFNCDYCSLDSMDGSPLAVSSTHGKTYIWFYLNSNKLSGRVTSSFFYIPYSPYNFYIDLTSNRLTSLSVDVFENADFTSSSSASFSFGFNQFTGDMPNVAGRFGTSGIYYWAQFDSSGFTGTIPPTFLSSITANSLPSATSRISLAVPRTGLTGTLWLPDFSATPNVSLSLAAPSSDFTSIFFPNASSGLTSLSLINLRRLTGSLPTSLFQFNTKLTSIWVNRTPFSGDMPDMGALNLTGLTTLYMPDTNIDFCSGTRTPWTSSTINCELLHTTAFYCPQLYPSRCTTSAPLIPPKAPVTPPQQEVPVPSFVTTPPPTLPPTEITYPPVFISEPMAPEDPPSVIAQPVFFNEPITHAPPPTMDAPIAPSPITSLPTPITLQPTSTPVDPPNTVADPITINEPVAPHSTTTTPFAPTLVTEPALPPPTEIAPAWTGEPTVSEASPNLLPITINEPVAPYPIAPSPDDASPSASTPDNTSTPAIINEPTEDTPVANPIFTSEPTVPRVPLTITPALSGPNFVIIIITPPDSIALPPAFRNPSAVAAPVLPAPAPTLDPSEPGLPIEVIPAPLSSVSPVPTSPSVLADPSTLEPSGASRSAVPLISLLLVVAIALM